MSLFPPCKCKYKAKLSNVSLRVYCASGYCNCAKHGRPCTEECTCQCSHMYESGVERECRNRCVANPYKLETFASGPVKETPKRERPEKDKVALPNKRTKDNEYLHEKLRLLAEGQICIIKKLNAIIAVQEAHLITPVLSEINIDDYIEE